MPRAAGDHRHAEARCARLGRPGRPGQLDYLSEVERADALGNALAKLASSTADPASERVALAAEPRNPFALTRSALALAP
ncbi:MAG: hypothetical protein U0610_08495 [bacterium]